MPAKQTPDRYKKMGLIGRLIEDIVLLAALVRDFALGRYRRVPLWSILVFLGAGAYVLFPLDFIPDYIPGYGQIDDAIVALVCLFLLEKDLSAYKQWKNNPKP